MARSGGKERSILTRSGPFAVEITTAIDLVASEAWDALAGTDNPFVEHAFLQLLERSGSVGSGTSWAPHHVLAVREGRLAGAAPAYLRGDSYGEYIFDWAWAEAAERAGIRYYPKLLVAVPFTPATGPRLLAHPHEDATEVRRALVAGLTALQSERGASSTHVLFCTDAEASALETLGFHRRATHQFHWRNHGYASFEDFLGAFRSSARKQVRKERRRVAEAGLTIVKKVGREISAEDWQILERLYRTTGNKKWGRPYLTPGFFSDARDTIGLRAIAVLALREGRVIAGTLSFQKGRHLFGRYWGALEDHDALHFELCYYQLLDHAIAEGLTLVEAGAQGEHKVKRGFMPVAVHSAHRFTHPGLDEGIARFLRRERAEVLAALPHWAEQGPFREGARPPYPLSAGIDL